MFRKKLATSLVAAIALLAVFAATLVAQENGSSAPSDTGGVCFFQSPMANGQSVMDALVAGGEKDPSYRGLHQVNANHWPGVDTQGQVRPIFQNGGRVVFAGIDSAGGGNGVIIDGIGSCEGWRQAVWHMPTVPPLQAGQVVDGNTILGQHGNSGVDPQFAAHNHISVGLSAGTSPFDFAAYKVNGYWWIHPARVAGGASLNSRVDTESGGFLGKINLPSVRLPDSWETWVGVIVVILIIIVLIALAPEAAAAAGGAILAGGKAVLIYSGKAAWAATKFGYKAAYKANIIRRRFSRAAFGSSAQERGIIRSMLYALWVLTPLFCCITTLALVTQLHEETGLTLPEMGAVLAAEKAKGDLCDKLPFGQNSCRAAVYGEGELVQTLTAEAWQAMLALAPNQANAWANPELFIAYSPAASGLPQGPLPFPYWNGNQVSFQADPVLWGGILQAVTEIRAEEGWTCDPLLLLAIAHSESPSWFNDVNSIGAAGYYQFMPGTYPGVADAGSTLSDRMDPRLASKAACRYTKRTKALQTQTTELGFVAEFAHQAPVWNQHDGQARYAWQLWQWLRQNMHVPAGVQLAGEHEHVSLAPPSPSAGEQALSEFLQFLEAVSLGTYDGTPSIRTGDDTLFVSPYVDYSVTQKAHGQAYGHLAIDIAKGRGTTVFSPINGTVTANYVDEYGNTTLVIENGRFTVTMLHGDWTVEKGQQLTAGATIGTESNHGYTMNYFGKLCGEVSYCGNHTHLNVYDKTLGANVYPGELLP